MYRRALILRDWGKYHAGELAVDLTDEELARALREGAADTNPSAIGHARDACAKSGAPQANAVVDRFAVSGKIVGLELTDAQRASLKRELPQAYSAAHDAFLSEVLSGVATLIDNSDAGMENAVALLQDLHTTAKKLANAITGIEGNDPALIVLEGLAGLEPDENLLSRMRRDARHLAALTKGLSLQRRASADEFAVRLSAMVAAQWFKHFGQWPRKTTRLGGNDFARFMRECSEMVGVPRIGHINAGKGVNQAKNLMKQ